MKLSHSQKSAVDSTHTRVTNLSLSVQHLQLWKYIGLCSILNGESPESCPQVRSGRQSIITPEKQEQVCVVQRNLIESHSRGGSVSNYTFESHEEGPEPVSIYNFNSPSAAATGQR